MKIEDIKYTLPTVPIEGQDFDREKWLKENPIDYFKFLYILLNSKEQYPQIPSDIVTSVVFDVLYSVIRIYIPNTLYKFYSLNENSEMNEKKFETLQNNQIFMSDLKEFNDPFDGKAFFYNPKDLASIPRLMPHNGRFIDDFTAFVKGTSLTENDTSCMPMWAHYGNNHRGFCVAYDMKNPNNKSLASCTFPVQYTSERLDITSFMKDYAIMISSEIERYKIIGEKKIVINDLSMVYLMQYLINIKHSSWQYEKEFRCTMGALAKGMPYADAFSKAIYIGMNCSAQHSKRLIEIGKRLSIPVYQMKFDDLSEQYELKEDLITK